MRFVVLCNTLYFSYEVSQQFCYYNYAMCPSICILPCVHTINVLEAGILIILIDSFCSTPLKTKQHNYYMINMVYTYTRIT